MSTTAAVAPRDTGLPPPAATKTRARWKKPLLALAAAAALTGAAWGAREWWTTGRFIESTDDAYVGGNVTALAAHIPAYVAAVLVDDNQFVHAGDVLIRLDRRDYEAAVDRAQATLAARRASLAALRAQIEQQRSTIAQLDAELATKMAQAAFAVQDADRYRTLAQTAAASRQDAQRTSAADQQARSAIAAANAGLQAGRQRMAVLDANIDEAKALIVSADADLKTASLNLDWTDIHAPVDGYVGNRAARVGAYAAAGSYITSVIPSQGLWVDANFKEDQLRAIGPGQEATVIADALPSHKFHAHVESLAPGTGGVFSVIPPENATGNFTKIVQRVPVRVRLDPDDKMLDRLRPGLSTTVSIDTRSKSQ